MQRDKTVFCCSQCGSESRKWMGRCPACGAWNSMVEESVRKPANVRERTGSPPIRLMDVSPEDAARASTGIGELDRVLGGGVVAGSLILIGGDPGIGKSTLLLQAAGALARDGRRVLYVSGEESARQVAMRAARLGVRSEHLFILPETDLGVVIERIEALDPSFVVVDSIQTIYNPELSPAPGSVSQVRDCAAAFMEQAKTRDRSVFLVGHVTKSGALAGPRVLEHMVDTVLYFEGDADHAYRVLRTVKNRFGSTNEIGLFEMREEGMAEVANPSEMLLGNRGREAPGTVVAASLEGTRPVLVEVQALVSSTVFGMPRRQAAGVDYNRMVLLLAVLEKRAGMRLCDQDVYMNVAGGLRLVEPAADLGIVMAAASAFRGTTLSEDTAVFGEVGLTGEVRPVRHAELRLAEVHRTGFTRAILPRRNAKGISVPPGLELIHVATVVEALAQLR